MTMENNLVELKNVKRNTLEEENELLRQNILSSNRRNSELVEFNNQLMELLAENRKNNAELSHDTQRLAGEIVGRHNKKS